jgi:hypothetical protein
MADIKMNNLPNKSSTVGTDKVPMTDTEALNASKNITLDVIKEFINKFVDIDPTITKAWKEGRISYDPVYKSVIVDMGITDVRNSIGQEMYNIVYNNTASIIPNGTPVSVDLTLTGVFPNVYPSDSLSELAVIGYAGIATSEIGIGEVGFATTFGRVQGLDTSLLAESFIYLGENGTFVQERPKFPHQRLLLGFVEKSDALDGVINVQQRLLLRTDLSGGSYSFTSTGVLAGTYWKAGFYDWATTNTSLNEGSTTQVFGTIGRAYAAHASIVASGAGVVVGGGQVGLRIINSVKDSEDGIQVAGQSGIITEDITTLTADVYYETSEKFSGQITFELYVVSGTPTSYSLDFNYGYSKYEDFQNRDFTVTGFNMVWQGNANDSAFDVALMHHSSVGWTYATTGFEPGNGDICRKSVDQQLAGDVFNGEDGAYKRTGLNYYVAGEGSEGILVQITTGQNGTIQTSDINVLGKSEELLN